MKTHSEVRPIVELVVFVISMFLFFFDIVGVFGLAFAISGMLIAFVLVIAICLQRPSKDQVR